MESMSSSGASAAAAAAAAAAAGAINTAEVKRVMSDDRRRVRRVIEEIGGNRSRAFKIDDPACALLMEHAIEVSKAVLEGSLAVAQHKGNTKLEVEDVTLFLGE